MPYLNIVIPKSYFILKKYNCNIICIQKLVPTENNNLSNLATHNRKFLRRLIVHFKSSSAISRV